MIAQRRAKIVCTLGPASSSEDIIRRLIVAGMNVARLNMSHGDHKGHLENIKTIRKLAVELEAPVAILADLQGPKIRCGVFPRGSILLEDGEQITVTTEDVQGNENIIPCDFDRLHEVVNPGQQILLDDGLLEFKVRKVDGKNIECEVIHGGVLKNRKGMNIPGVMLPISAMTEKDHKDLAFLKKNQVDYIALSFARQGQDIRELKEELEGTSTKVVAKIEMLEALENLEEIIRLSDGVMVARGDLAIEAGQTRLAGLQKRIIHLANQAGRPVITATQMLDSMIENPRPTRAEITDVSNSVIDGTDAVMLSGETASGKYPVECVQTLHDILSEVEKDDLQYYKIDLTSQFSLVPRAIAASATLAAQKLDAKAIVCLTTSGRTATMISMFRPKAKVIAVTDLVETLNRLELVWGLQTLKMPPCQSMEEAINEIVALLVKYRIVRVGDKIIMTLGLPIKERKKTNTLRVVTASGDDLAPLPPLQRPARCR